MWLNPQSWSCDWIHSPGHVTESTVLVMWLNPQSWSLNWTHAVLHVKVKGRRALLVFDITTAACRLREDQVLECYEKRSVSFCCGPSWSRVIPGAAPGSSAEKNSVSARAMKEQTLVNLCFSPLIWKRVLSMKVHSLHIDTLIHIHIELRWCKSKHNHVNVNITKWSLLFCQVDRAPGSLSQPLWNTSSVF